MSDAKRDANRVPTLIGVSSADGTTPTDVEIDATTGEILVRARTVETAPTDASKVNASVVLSYNAAGDLIVIEKTIGVTTYTKTISNVDEVVSTTKTISAWS